MERREIDAGTAGDKVVNVADPADVKKWCREFQCNEMRLKNAVRAVGTSADAVRLYMTKNF